MIIGAENIADVFSIFHDGRISAYAHSNNTLILTIDIEYLANRTQPPCRGFTLELDDTTNIKFTTWPNDDTQQPVIMSASFEPFESGLEILEGNVKDERVAIVCVSHDSRFGYCGGELEFGVHSASVFDGNGKEYSLEELNVLCKAYWDEWAANSERQ